MELTKENYKKFGDLSIFPTDQLIETFLSIPKVETLGILRRFDHDFRESLFNDAPDHLAKQWKTSLKYKTNSVGELMQPAPLVLNENMTIEEAITEMRKIPKVTRSFAANILSKTFEKAL